MDLDEKIKFLKQTTVFSTIDFPALKVIAELADELHFKEGDIIFHEGEIANCLYLIAKGNLRIIHRGAEVATLSPLEFVGEMSIVDDKPRSADAVSAGDSVLFRITRQSYLEIVSQFPHVSLEISKLLANRIRMDNQKLLVQYQEIQNRKLLERDLEIARQIQQKLLPQRIPKIPNLEISAKCISAKKVGGDFYEFIQFAENNEKKIGIITGDVSGKGISAAMIMANSKGILNAEAFDHINPGKTLTHANKWLKKDTPQNMFLALFYGVIDSENMEMVYSCAGQPLPLILREGIEHPFYVPKNDFRVPLGSFHEIFYDEKNINLMPNDLIVMCSDGVLEAANQQGEMWSFAGLENTVTRCKNLSAQEALSLILDELTEFTKNTEMYDDYTLVVIKLTK